MLIYESLPKSISPKLQLRGGTEDNSKIPVFFFYFSVKTCCGPPPPPHYRLDETVLIMMGHKKGFCGKIWIIIPK